MTPEQLQGCIDRQQETIDTLREKLAEAARILEPCRDPRMQGPMARRGRAWLDLYEFEQSQQE